MENKENTGEERKTKKKKLIFLIPQLSYLIFIVS